MHTWNDSLTMKPSTLASSPRLSILRARWARHWLIWTRNQLVLVVAIHTITPFVSHPPFSCGWLYGAPKSADDCTRIWIPYCIILSPTHITVFTEDVSSRLDFASSPQRWPQHWFAFSARFHELFISNHIIGKTRDIRLVLNNCIPLAILNRGPMTNIPLPRATHIIPHAACTLTQETSSHLSMEISGVGQGRRDILAPLSPPPLLS